MSESDDGVVLVINVFISVMVLVSALWNVYQIYQHMTLTCQRPEDREQFDGDARLMLEEIYNSQLQCHAEWVEDLLENVHAVVMAEDSKGKKRIYFDEKFIRKVMRPVVKGKKQNKRRRLPSSSSGSSSSSEEEEE